MVRKEGLGLNGLASGEKGRGWRDQSGLGVACIRLAALVALPAHQQPSLYGSFLFPCLTHEQQALRPGGFGRCSFSCRRRLGSSRRDRLARAAFASFLPSPR